MGRRIGLGTSDTKEYIIAQPTPNYGVGNKRAYAVISHVEVMIQAEDLLSKAGLQVEEVLYSCVKGAAVARGIYHIKGGDEDLQMMFAWVNSYDKSKRFSCAIGSKIKDSGYWLSGDIGSWKRKHTGDAKKEAMETMSDQINNAGKYYQALLGHKAEMILVKIPEKLRAEVLGRIYFLEKIITSEQAGIVKSLLMTPGADDTLWQLNKWLAAAMRKSHPKDWLEKSIQLSGFLNKEFGIGQAVAPIQNQMTLIQMIEEVKAEAIAKEKEAPVKDEISFEL